MHFLSVPYKLYELCLKRISNTDWKNRILGYHHHVDEVLALLGCYTACWTFQDNLFVPSSRVKNSKKNSYQHMLHNNAKEWKAGRKYSLFNQCIKNMKQQCVFLTQAHKIETSKFGWKT